MCVRQAVPRTWYDGLHRVGVPLGQRVLAGKRNDIVVLTPNGKNGNASGGDGHVLFFGLAAQKAAQRRQYCGEITAPVRFCMLQAVDTFDTAGHIV